MTWSNLYFYIFLRVIFFSTSPRVGGRNLISALIGSWVACAWPMPKPCRRTVTGAEVEGNWGFPSVDSWFMLVYSVLFNIWLVVWNIWIIFPYIGNNHPNWRSHIFQRGWNHQPDENGILGFEVWMNWHGRWPGWTCFKGRSILREIIEPIWGWVKTLSPWWTSK